MKKSKMYLLLTLSGILIAGQALTQPQTSFSLREAQEYALKNNIQVKNAMIDVEIAKKKIWETTAQGLPQVSASLDYTYMPTVPEMKFSTPYLINPATPTGLNADQIKLGYQQIPIELGVKSSATIKASVSQLVFNGSYIVGLQTARIFKNLSEQSLKSTENNIRENVANSYCLILLAETNLKLLGQMKTNLDKTLNDMKSMLQEGFIENTDVDQFQYTVTTVGNTMQAIERQLNVAKRLFNFQLGLPLDQPVLLTDNLETIMNNTSVESLVNADFDLNNNITYQLLKTQEQMMVSGLNLNKSAFLPSIVAFYTHQEKTAKADFDFTFPDMIGLSLNVPVFSSGMRLSSVQQARLQLEKTRNSNQMAIEGLKLDFEKTKMQLQSAYDKFLNEKANMELAEKIYNKTLLKYKEGISTSMELTQANNQLLNAQTNYFSALIDMLNAKHKLENLMNKQ